MIILSTFGDVVAIFGKIMRFMLLADGDFFFGEALISSRESDYLVLVTHNRVFFSFFSTEKMSAFFIKKHS